MTIASTTLDAFTRATAAKEPVPGGGAVAAVTLAHAASLASMVISFSRGKKAFVDHESFLEATAARLEVIRAEALSLADQDAEAFKALAPLFTMKQDDPDRQAMVLPAVTAAIKPPAEMLTLAAETAALCQALIGRSSKMLKSDLAISACLAAAAADAAAWNVRINLPMLREAGGDATLSGQLDETVKQTATIAKAVAAACLE